MKVRRSRGRISVALTEDEKYVVRSLAGGVADMLGVAEAGDDAADPLEAMVGVSHEAVAPPEDEALQRLLPDAYPEDDKASAEFRRLMDIDLRRQKSAALATMVDELTAAQDGAAVSLTQEQAAGWVQAINDVRLVLGVRLDVQEDSYDEWAQMTADDPRLPLVLAYELTTYLQQELVEALSN